MQETLSIGSYYAHDGINRFGPLPHNEVVQFAESKGRKMIDPHMSLAWRYYDVRIDDVVHGLWCLVPRSYGEDHDMPILYLVPQNLL